MRKTFLLAVALTLPLISHAGREKVIIDGPNGQLVAEISTPELQPGQKCPMVILMHGFMGNRRGPVEAGMADSLDTRNMASIRFDFDGHGESGGDFVDMSVPKEIEDAIAVYNYVRALPYVSGIAFCGHSQGGVVASMTAGQLGQAVSAVVLFAPAAVLREDSIRGNVMGAMFEPLDPPESVDLFGGRLKLGREYITTSFSLPIYETAAGYDGPACILHGTGDKVVPYTYGARYHYLWPKSELHLIEAEDHMFSHDLPAALHTAVDFLVRTL